MSELKDKWIEALRSDRFKQTENVLRDKDDGYCCLGVLCEISGIGFWEDSLTYYEESNAVPRYTFRLKHPAFDINGDPYGYETALPKELRETVGLTGKQHSMLQHVNDEGETFAQIADRIEQGNYED